jgi:outer membrane protein OmpA-like peptidoglycan-associated protein
MRRTLASIACVVALLAFGGSAFAQAIPNDRFSANRFSPAPGAGNYLMVDGGTVGGHLTPSFGLLVDYAHRPLVLFDSSCPGNDTDNCEVTDSEKELISYALTTNLMATLTLWQRLQLGLLMPFVLTDGESFRSSTPLLGQPFVDIRGGTVFGPGDPRVSAKVRLVGDGAQGFNMSAVAFLGLPLGQVTSDDGNLGDDTVTAGGHLALEHRAGAFRYGVNFGGVVRPSRQLLSTEVGSEFTYGGGMGFEITPLFALIGEVTGVTQFTSQLDENPVEGRIAGQLTQWEDWVFTLGAGAGLLAGVGVPNFRLLGGVAYVPVGLDSDGDGIKDKVDRCPTDPEDEDGYLEDDGCPDLDNDADGIEDARDKCPDDPEDPDGFQDEDGCRDADNDGDKIQDGYDSCPMEAEDKDGDRDDDGCPDNDRDRDGIADAADKCPNDPEDTDGFGDEDGCPEADFDGDGVVDDEDQCPDQPETMNGKDDADGCPDGKAAPPPPPLVTLTCEKIEIGDRVFFDTNKDTIQSRSFPLLDQVAAALGKAKHVKKIRVEGHTDSQGNDKRNLDLSGRRAAAVVKYLAGKGVAAERLTSEGFGETRPIADNKTKDGRAANRRVEFVIVEQDASGCKQ